MSSSKTSFFRSASSLNGPKNSASTSLSVRRNPSSFSRCRNWCRPAVLAQDQLALRQAHRLRVHDLVGRPPSSGRRRRGCPTRGQTRSRPRRACCGPPPGRSRGSPGGWSAAAARVWMPVVHPPKTSGRVFSAMTTSSSAALPARSPMPLTVTSTCRAPAWTAASVLATAMPRSLWQWTAMTALRMFETCSNRYSIRRRNSLGRRPARPCREC